MRIFDLKAFIRSKYHHLPQHQKPVVLIVVAALSMVFFILLLKGCVTLISGKKKLENVLVIRQGERLIIPPNSPLRSQIQIKKVTVTATPHYVSFPGLIEAMPSHIVNIVAPFTGRLKTLHARLGDQVKQGQVLAIISSSDLARVSADHDKALSQFKLSQDALKRAKQVHLAGANATKDIETATHTYKQALVDLSQTEATLKIMDNNSFTDFYIKSPLSGQITAQTIGTGAYINDPTATLFTIANVDHVWVNVNIPEIYAGNVAKDLPVNITMPAYPEQVLHGSVSFVNALLEPDTRRNKTRIVLANPKGKLQPNMFATVSIALPEPATALVPLSAVLMNNDTTSVFVEVGPWTFVRKDVVLGKEDDEQVRVVAGLKDGDRVVISGGVLVND